MTLSELLSLLRGAILNDRSDRTAGSNDYLWTDETLVTYMNEAQRLFATKGLVLRDATTPAVTTVTLVAGQTVYPLHESVIAVLSARRGDQDVDLTRVGHAVLAAYRPPSESWVDPSGYTQMPAGVPLAYSTDEGLGDQGTDSFSQMQLRVYPAPSAAVAGSTIRLRVCRKPLDPLDVGSPSGVPEIPEDHHIEMLDHAAYLALRIVDDDGGNIPRAMQFKETFDAAVAEARRQVMRKLFAPTGWGFGRGGFTWDR